MDSELRISPKPGHVFRWIHGRSEKSLFVISEVYENAILSTRGVHYHINEIEIDISLNREIIIEKIIND